MVRRSLFAALVVLVAALGGSALADEWKSPIEHAKAGQWARYKMMNDMEMKQTVSKVDGRRVVIQQEMFLKGKAFGAPVPVTRDLDKKSDADASKKGEQGKWSEDSLLVNGKTLKCKLLTQGTQRSWFSEDVPIDGLVKTEMDGKTTMELVDWGDK